MEEQGNGRQGGAGRVAGAALLVFLLVYFLFPVAFIWPLYIAYGPSSSPPPMVEKFLRVFFWPIIYVADHVPPYRRLIDKEGELIGLK